MLFACLRTTFCPAVSAAARFLQSRESAAVRMMLLLHPPELKETSPMSPTEFTTAEFIKGLLKNENKLKKYIHSFASGI